jgi:two-component system, NtrC family, nitrogen regulation response regulator NtrX
VKGGSFREDLYFRLNVIPLALPPLRDRRPDIIPLVGHFSEQFFKRTGRPRPVWRSDALAMLEEYPWPGNVRELANLVERLAILHPGMEISSRELTDVLPREGQIPRASAKQPDVEEESGERKPLVDVLDSYERNVIRQALADAKGNIAEAARRLQTDRPNLYRRMRRLGIDANGVQ